MGYDTNMHVENLELPRRTVEITFPDGYGELSLALARAKDYDALVAELKVGRAVTTAIADVRCPTPTDCDGWHALASRLEPLRTLLSFAQRRSIDLRIPPFRHRDLPADCDEPNRLASTYRQKLLPDECLEEFTNASLRALSGPPDGDGASTWYYSLRYYLSSFRDGLWLEERFFALTLALEIAADTHAGDNTRLVPDKGAFGALNEAVASTIDSFSHALTTQQAEVLKCAFGNANRRSFRDKVLVLLGDCDLSQYDQDARQWINVRNDLAHEGRTVKLETGPEDRIGGFFGCYVQGLRGCLERLFLRCLAPSLSLCCVDFTDCSVRPPE